MKWLSALAMGVGWLGLGTTGCGPAEGAPWCPDPASGVVDEECGVWVSASLGDDANPGTRAAPMASLSAAAERASALNVNVYACGELWTEPVIVPRNVSFYGGFDCLHGWVYDGVSRRSRIETGPDQIPLRTIEYIGFLTISDFDIVAADAAVPGGSSIAVLLGDIGTVTLQRCLVRAGNAADGLDGEVIDEAATTGAAGDAGADACSAMDGPGGAAVETTCGPDDGSRGGKGGDGGAMLATDGEAGLPAPPGEKEPSNQEDGDGGKGQSGLEACTPGEPGANGEDGAFAIAQQKLGTLSVDGFAGVDGGDGQPGQPGQGGGGGGASRGGAAACGAASPGGAGGGSGGAGGCGGKGGKGGQAGGSSFAVVVVGAKLVVDTCDFWVGEAGNGGDGAPGQPGGAGGEPGAGGNAQGTAQAGCQGGKGGAGGKGGGGAGGHGGHAIHIVLTGKKDTKEWTTWTFNGNTTGGLGGDGGDPTNQGEGWYGEGNDKDWYLSIRGSFNLQ